MVPGKPSATAAAVAHQRALHQLMDRPLVFEDTVAIRMLAPEEQERLAAGAGEERYLGGLRALAAARSRFCEDALAAAVKGRKATQYVILAAGLDTFAYRSPFAGSLQVFEIDFPASQAWKRQRLKQASIAEPPWLTFVPLDLDSGSLMGNLLSAGVNVNEPTFFGALGLLNYLSPPTVRQTFQTVAAFAAESEIAFDYALPPNLLPPAARPPMEAWLAGVAAGGEPVLSFLIPSQLHDTLAAIGFRDVELLDAAAINARYFLGRRDRVRVPAHFTLARAIL
jgi:methyltransferase (TIGR00027 family)